MSKLANALLIVICTGLIVFIGSSRRPLLKSSEGRVACVAQEMLDSGDWVVPHLNGEVRKEKPPLSSWLVAFCAIASGSRQVEPWHAFLPVGVCAILLVLLVWFWLSAVVRHRGESLPTEPGRNWLPMAGALMLATAPGFVLQARSAELDMLLALLIAAAFYGFWLHRCAGRAGGLLLAYAALGLSVLTKGHVGLVMALPAVWLWLIVERSRQSLPLMPGRRWLWHLAGGALLCLIVLPWAVPFLQRSGITWADFNREGGSGRLGGSSHREVIQIGGLKINNVFWYLCQLPGWMLPWSLLLPLGLWQTHSLPPDERSPLRRLCWLWLGWGVLLLSVLSSKQRHYAVPLFAPLAMLTADTVLRWLTHFDAAKQVRARLALLVCSVLVGVGLLGAAGVWAKGLPREALPVLMIGVICLLVFVLAGVAARQKAHCFFLWWAGAICAAALLMITTEKYESQTESPVPFCRAVREKVPPDAKLYDYGVVLANNTWRAQALFCLQHKVERPELPLAELLASGRWHVLVNEKTILAATLKNYDVLAREKDFLGHKNDVMLIRSRP
jgi:4-amino-4-deoxy-L-arabinose transferase-like glycosyltransferase